MSNTESQRSRGGPISKPRRMTHQENALFLTCVTDGGFYTRVEKYVKSPEPSKILENLKQLTNIQRIKEGLKLDKKQIENVVANVVDHYSEEYPQLLEIYKINKYPEFAHETKHCIKHRTDTEETLRNIKQTIQNTNKLIGEYDMSLKYPKGFHSVLIYNNMDVNDLNKEDLMEAIREEAAKIKSVADLLDSKTIQKDVQKAQENIKKLTELLDKEE